MRDTSKEVDVEVTSKGEWGIERPVEACDGLPLEELDRARVLRNSRPHQLFSRACNVSFSHSPDVSSTPAPQVHRHTFSVSSPSADSRLHLHDVFITACSMHLHSLATTSLTRLHCTFAFDRLAHSPLLVLVSSWMDSPVRLHRVSRV